MTLTASHDGYRRLSDPVRHTRTFVWLGQVGIVVVDRLEGLQRFVTDDEERLRM